MDLRSLLLSVSLCAATYGVGQAQRLQTNSSDTSVSTVVRMDIQQNKVNYAPGEAVRFTLEGTLPDGAHVRYRYGNTIIGDETLSRPQWTWTPPKDDYRGYLVELYTKKESGEPTVLATTAVDVSSDWGRFPRYGFVSDYDKSKTKDVIEREMAFLNRCHVNGIQFYDWQYKQHSPLGIDKKGRLFTTYKDIANRQIVTQVLQDYIATQHAYGMKAMYYDLCFGAFRDAAKDGVSDRWYIFKDKEHRVKDGYNLPKDWKSDILIVNPGNKSWQSYFADRSNDVYQHLDFDGFHIDQLGKRGDVYDYYGEPVDLPAGYATFIEAMKAKNPDRRLVMNSVSSFGAKEIAEAEKTDFLYNELWEEQDKFSDIHNVIKANSDFSKGKKNTVLAAYMNYRKGFPFFNTPGVLLTDAVIFALGGAHIELSGDHMLYSEYFPDHKTQMDSGLRKAIVGYYDFMTAYQNLLRDGGKETNVDVSAADPAVSINAWPPRQGAVAAYAKTFDGKEVIQLLNFRQANSMSWRDLNGTMPEPQLLQNLTLRIKTTGMMSKVWTASPDVNGGSPQSLDFHQADGYLTVTLPSLKYWTILVLER